MKTIYLNGEIVTVDDQLPSAEAIVVENGIITFVGSNEKALHHSTLSHRIVDLKGKVMTPGFIDPHSHFLSASILSDAISIAPPPIGSCLSIADIIRVIKSEIQRRKIKKWKTVIALSYDDSLFLEKRNITKDDLDQISTEHPILIGHQSMHVGCINSALLKRCKIDETTPNPDGGIIERFANSAIPNGRLQETAFHHVFKKVFKVNPFTLKRLIGQGNKLYFSNGITTAQEGAVDKKLLNLANLAKNLKWFSLDLVGYYRCTKVSHFDDLHNLKKSFSYKNNFRIGGAKFFLDGSPQAKTAWLSKPYHVVPEGLPAEYSGYPLYKDSDFVKAILKETIARNYQILVHCNGDQAAEQYVSAYQEAHNEQTVKRNLRPVMIHAQTVREDQMDRMKEIGMIPSFFHDHTFYWGDWHLDSVLGPERGRRISPVNSALQRELPFTLHQDTPVVPPNMIFTLWTSVNRKTRSGKIIGEEQRISPLEALKAITIHAAYQYFEEKSKGSITVGKRADLVILDRNPLTVEPDSIKSIRVLETNKDPRAKHGVLSHP